MLNTKEMANNKDADDIVRDLRTSFGTLLVHGTRCRLVLFRFSGPHLLKGVTLGDEPKGKTIYSELINGVASPCNLITLLGSGYMTPTPQYGFMKGRCDKRQIGERQQDRTGNGWIDFNDKRNFPERLTENGEADTFQSEKSRGSDLTEFEDTDKATRKLHPRHVLYNFSTN